MATSRDPSNGFSDSDQQWFDRLSGKPGVVTDAEAIHEADALKLALRIEREAADADPELADATSDEALQRQWEQLQFRLKREGLAAAARPRWRRWPALAGMAAAVVLAAVLSPMYLGQGDADYGEPPVMRGDFVTLRKAAAQPVKEAEAFAAELRAAGLRPGLYQRGKTLLVDVDVTAAQLTAATPAFERLALKPVPALIRVEFTPSGR